MSLHAFLFVYPGLAQERLDSALGEAGVFIPLDDYPNSLGAIRPARTAEHYVP